MCHELKVEDWFLKEDVGTYYRTMFLVLVFYKIDMYNPINAQNIFRRIYKKLLWKWE